MPNYWEQEQPIEVTAKKNVMKYYAKAGRLMVSRPSWEDGDGNVKPGKTVTLDIRALAEEAGEVKAAARSIFENIIKTMEG